MSHEQIATHLGTAREVVSRLLSQLEGDGLVRLGRRRVHITSPQELRRVVGPG
jgi:CRP/FNR family transcriptional regulator